MSFSFFLFFGFLIFFFKILHFLILFYVKMGWKCTTSALKNRNAYNGVESKRLLLNEL
jgi:hypothetical protein